MARAEFNGMKCRLAGHSGLYLSEVGLGTWKWGYPSYDGSRLGEHEAFQVMDRALELGVFHWDTACSYNESSGNSERVLGRYFASRPREVRDQVVLATKVCNTVRPEHVTRYSFTPNQSGGSRGYVRSEVDRCLRRLQTDYIDLLYLHSPVTDGEGNYICPLEETWSALDELVSAGKVNYLGVSNHTVQQIEDVSEVLQKVGKDFSRRVIVVQNRYSLLERDGVAGRGPTKSGGETEFLRFCKERQIGIVPHSPLAAGMLTGRYRRDNLEEVHGRIVDEGTEEQFLTERNFNAVEGLRGLAQHKGITMAGLAIAWLLSRPQVASVIAGVTKMQHLEDNAGATNVELTDEDLQRIGGVLKQADEASEQ